MKIGIIGTGYVGLVTGSCLAELSHDVVCIDQKTDVIKSLNQGTPHIYEPGLESLIQNNLSAGRLSFTTQAQALKDCDAVFIAVGTPMNPDGSAGLHFIEAAARSLSEHISKFTLIINKSTVPIGTGGAVSRILSERLNNELFDVASNPEFLREGSAVNDFMQPDRIVIGTENDKAKGIMDDIYKPLVDRQVKILHTDRNSAELIKYASNSFLATKLSFINEICNICEAVGANIQDVTSGMGLDSRIGDKFLVPGPGYGGSCFPKDTLALIHTASENNIDLKVIGAAEEVNSNRKAEMAERISQALKGDLNGKVCAIWGLSFKANTDDVRESVALEVIPRLQAKGAIVRAFDPQAMGNASQALEGVTFTSSASEAAANADALIILTEWNEFKTFNLAQLKDVMRGNILCDFRNLLNEEDAHATGFIYHQLGKRLVML